MPPNFCNNTHCTLEIDHALMRNAVPFLEGERIVSDDINKALTLIRDGSVMKAVAEIIPDLE